MDIGGDNDSCHAVLLANQIHYDVWKKLRDDLLLRNEVRKIDNDCRKKMRGGLTVSVLKKVWQRQNGRCAISQILLDDSRFDNVDIIFIGRSRGFAIDNMFLVESRIKQYVGPTNITKNYKYIDSVEKVIFERVFERSKLLPLSKLEMWFHVKQFEEHRMQCSINIWKNGHITSLDCGNISIVDYVITFWRRPSNSYDVTKFTVELAEPIDHCGWIIDRLVQAVADSFHWVKCYNI